MSNFKVEFKDFSIEVQNAIDSLAQSTLEEVGGELESAVKRNTAVDTGRTKNSWQHRLASSKDRHEVSVGSDYMNAVWEEFGTGEYALNGDGRKGGWFYEDEEGNGHFTHGKHPRRPFWKAYTSSKNKLVKIVQDRFKRGLS